MRAALLAAACCAASVSADFTAPEFTVDLDKSAYDRWAPVANGLINARGYNYTWAPLHAFLEKVLPHKVWVETEPLWMKVLAGYPEFYQEEIHAYYKWVTEQGHTEWTLGQMVMVQLFYEVEDACTSIVSQHTNGTIFHGRNLDYGLPGLENFTASIRFTKGGKPVAQGTMYVGYCGLLTGQKLNSDGTGAWAVSLDQRFYGKTVIPYIPTIKQFLAGVQNVGFFLRDTLTSAPDFETALPLLKDTKIPAPSYLIASGLKAGEGAVITRDRNGTSYAAGTGRGFWPIDADKGAWYRLETNFDNWEPLTDGRRKHAHEGMDALGQSGADMDGIFSVLSTPPVLAKDTTYTAMMINEAGFYRTTVREHSAKESAERTAKMQESVSKKMQDLVAWYRQQPFYVQPQH
eukprot:TRINITY_DN1781_c0_g1_i1.p1 TRINITY_DN1781_c0_g1~~TRINITY_DN1781_c0_g1_i1.p1  ORF type:complete len:424 (+),score=171.92 TRINITY_DN1781_c0_g1_i1:63-1274(+)